MTSADAPLVRLPFEATPIRTERLLLRPLEADDLDDVAAYQSLLDVVRYLYWPVRDRAESVEHLSVRSGYVRLDRDGDVVVFAMEAVLPGTDRARVIGDLTLFLRSVASAQFEIGWVLHPDAQGRGFATEGARALLDLAWRLGAARVTAQLDDRNSASAALCLRLGMHEEAHQFGDQFVKGEWTNSLTFAIRRPA